MLSYSSTAELFRQSSSSESLPVSACLHSLYLLQKFIAELYSLFAEYFLFYFLVATHLSYEAVLNFDEECQRECEIWSCCWMLRLHSPVCECAMQWCKYAIDPWGLSNRVGFLSLCVFESTQNLSMGWPARWWKGFSSVFAPAGVPPIN